jgi:hypothetical protein
MDFKSKMFYSRLNQKSSFEGNLANSSNRTKAMIDHFQSEIDTLLDQNDTFRDINSTTKREYGRSEDKIRNEPRYSGVLTVDSSHQRYSTNNFPNKASRREHDHLKNATNHFYNEGYQSNNNLMPRTNIMKDRIKKPRNLGTVKERVRLKNESTNRHYVTGPPKVPSLPRQTFRQTQHYSPITGYHHNNSGHRQQQVTSPTGEENYSLEARSVRSPNGRELQHSPRDLRDDASSYQNEVSSTDARFWQPSFLEREECNYGSNYWGLNKRNRLPDLNELTSVDARDWQPTLLKPISPVLRDHPYPPHQGSYTKRTVLPPINSEIQNREVQKTRMAEKVKGLEERRRLHATARATETEQIKESLKEKQQQFDKEKKAFEIQIVHLKRSQARRVEKLQTELVEAHEVHDEYVNKLDEVIGYHEALRVEEIKSINTALEDMKISKNNQISKLERELDSLRSKAEATNIQLLHPEMKEYFDRKSEAQLRRATQFDDTIRALKSFRSRINGGYGYSQKDRQNMDDLLDLLSDTFKMEEQSHTNTTKMSKILIKELAEEYAQISMKISEYDQMKNRIHFLESESRRIQRKQGARQNEACEMRQVVTLQMAESVLQELGYTGK